MDISDWRKKVDDVDLKLTALLNERAAAVIEIGRLKLHADGDIGTRSGERTGARCQQYGRDERGLQECLQR